MLAKLSVDQALMKAKSHANRGEIEEAQKIYQSVFQSYSKQAKDIKSGLSDLNKFSRITTTQDPPEDIINELINLYKQGQFSLAVEQAQILTKQYPDNFMIWNILGASAVQLELSDQAILAFKEVISLKPLDAVAYSNLGNAFQQKGNLSDAIDTCKKALSLDPNYANAYYNLANVLLDKGDNQEAIKFYKKYLLLISNNPDAYSNMGIALRNEGKFDEAIEAFKKSITLNPENVNTYIKLGNVLKHQGEFDESVNIFKKCVTLSPNNVDAYFNMATGLKSLKKFEESLEAYKKIIFLQPDHSLAHNNMANIFQEQERFDEAIATYQKAILFKPDYADAYNNMSVALQDKGELDEAIEACKKAISLNPDYAIAYNNMGNVLQDQGKSDDAIDAYKKSISLKPDYAKAYNNMGNTFQVQGKIEEAILAFQKSISLNPNDPETYFNISLSLLQSGRIKEGLEEYEWRHKTKQSLTHYRHFPQPKWDGKTSLKDKTILLWCEQGIGDTMNWSSCLNLLTSRAKHVILECQEKLVPLLSRSFPNVEVKAVDRSSDADRDDFDLHLPMGSLYKHFIDEIMENGMASSYLVADPDRVKFWRDRLHSVGKGPYIGVCWKSSVKSAYRLQHYPPMSEWAPVFKVPDVTFINLQYKDHEDDIAQVQDELGVTIHNLDDIDQYGDIDEVAALCCALDMVVSTKATPPMISAGVGIPTKIANWRQSNYNNILNNPRSTSLEMIHRDTWETWDKVFKSIADDILKLKN